jgi:hypothetical protein
VACIEQVLHANAADITRAACDKDVHKLESYRHILQHRVSLGNRESVTAVGTLSGRSRFYAKEARGMWRFFVRTA